MIEDFIKEIIEIDKKTDQDIRNIDQTVEDIDLRTTTLIRDKETEVISETTERCQRSYDEAIAKAKKERERVIQEAEITCENIRNYYEKVKPMITQEVIQLLFQVEE